MQYAFPCNIVPDESEGGSGYIVSFPDVIGCRTCGDTFKEAIILAEDALVVALAAYIHCQEELPMPSPRAAEQELIGVQLDLYTALREQSMGPGDLARRLGRSEKAAGKLLSQDYTTPIRQVMQAMAAVGVPPAAERAA